MTRHLTSLFMIAAALLALTACGSDDDPRPGNTRTITPTLLVHEGGDAPAWWVNNGVSITLDLDRLQASFNLGTLTPTAITGVPLNYDADENRYSFSQATNTSAAITQLRGTIDFNEGAVWISFAQNGTTVHLTPTAVFFTRIGTQLHYSDGTSGTYNNAIYQFDLDRGTGRADATIMELLVQNRFFNTITTQESIIRKVMSDLGVSQPLPADNHLTVTATPAGYKLTGTDLLTGSFYRRFDDQTGQEITKTLSYRFTAIDCEIDLDNGSMSGSYTLSDGTTATMSGTIY